MITVGQRIVIVAKGSAGVDRAGVVLERSRDRDGDYWLRVEVEMAGGFVWVREEAVIDRELYTAQDVIRESNYGDF